MKIVFLADGCHPGTQGGIQTFGRALKKIFKDKMIFLSYRVDQKKLYEVEDIIEVGSTNYIFRKINKITKNSLRDYLINKQLKKIKPDIIILRSPQDLKALKNINAKKILVQHNRFDILYSSKDYYNNEKKLLEKSKKEMDYFVVLSDYDKKVLREEYNFPENKIEVIRHSCELEIIKEKKLKNKNLLMIARIDNNQKRFDLAIKAMRKLQDFNLKIYGDGGRDEIEFLESLIKKYSLKNVRLCGATQNVKKVLDENGIFIMTSDFEGYGITNIEAMRRGLPIILRNTFDAAKDIVIDNGILLDKDWNEEKFVEAVKKVYDNYEYFSNNSVKLGERYNLDKIKKFWLKIFE